ncbi:MAG: glycosyltransferase [Desulfobacterales bacterium]|nr:glycosyltransferase [Desulfobacterales bacterium]
MAWNLLAMIGALIWLGLLLLPWRPWAVREALEAAPAGSGGDLSEVTAVIPARNEATVIVATLKALLAQGPGLGVILVDDRCTDDTPELARRVGGRRVRVISGAPLPPGWSGKLWALAQGVRHVRTPLTLLLDADIELAPGILKALLQKMASEEIALVSLMAHLRMAGLWGVLLPLIGTLFLAMTWTSAVRFWTGKGAWWKNRRYPGPVGSQGERP